MLLQMMIKTKTTVLNLKSPSYTLVSSQFIPALVCIMAKLALLPMNLLIALWHLSMQVTGFSPDARGLSRWSC